jgi:hypothetical protein
MVNPKCKSCLTYISEVELKSSGEPYKSCKRCRETQKAFYSKKTKKEDDEPDNKNTEYLKCGSCGCFKTIEEIGCRKSGLIYKCCNRCRNKEVKKADEPDNKNTININDIIYEKMDYSRDDIIFVNGDIYIKKK